MTHGKAPRPLPKRGHNANFPENWHPRMGRVTRELSDLVPSGSYTDAQGGGHGLPVPGLCSIRPAVLTPAPCRGVPASLPKTSRQEATIFLGSQVL